MSQAQLKNRNLFGIVVRLLRLITNSCRIKLKTRKQLLLVLIRIQNNGES